MAKTVAKNRVGGAPDDGRGTAAEVATIRPPNMRTAVFTVRGTAPYVQEKFSKKTEAEMKSKQQEGTTIKKTKRAPKDFAQCFRDSQYRPKGEAWPNGALPATAFRSAMIDACRLVDFKMTQGKQCVFVEHDGYEENDYTPLIRIMKGKPKQFEQTLKNANGSADIRVRAMWEPGWEAEVRIRYDADRVTVVDVSNLLVRAGIQVGIGAGRPASKFCAGCGWGTWEVVSK